VSDVRAQPLQGEPVARVLVAGAAGYTGALAAKLIWKHPRLELAAATARSEAGRRLDELYPGHEVPLELGELDLGSLGDLDAAIVAYPHRASAPVVAELRGRGLRVVDLSADFRLHDLRSYERWYGPHGAPELLAGAVYGLTELNRDAIAGAELVANPGCYPTATVLALAPLADAGLIADVVVDAKSGVSGAGRAAEQEMRAVKDEDDTRPYKVTGHRHQPEIVQELARLGVNGASVTFVPHLLPFDQGELVSCYARLDRELSPEELGRLYRERYEGERFVELADSPPGVSGVRGTNLCRIHAVAADGGRVLAFAAIDNLWKGAASQAIQNLNLMLGLPEGEGIE
jgi:N-acetyl-gamma-glutamyl-phosphate reductase